MYLQIQKITMSFKMRNWTRIGLLLAIFWEPSFCWRWKTPDAMVHDVWPDRETSKLKRASATTVSSVQSLTTTTKQTTKESEEDALIFDGHYFKPNEVPPPPPFMVDTDSVQQSNWRGSTSHPVKRPPTQSTYDHGPMLVYVSTPSGRFPPTVSQKFTDDNAKGFKKGSSDKRPPVNDSRNSDTTEATSTSDSKSIHVSSSVLEDLHSAVEQAESQLQQDVFQDAPQCFTATDTPGRCVPFKECFPVVFNVIDGDLRNPGLAKLLYQSSGPCNATLELEFAMRKRTDHKKFLHARFYNQTVCCPGFKHPPSLLKSRTKDRNTRLSDSKHSTEPPHKDSTTSASAEAITSRSTPRVTLGRHPVALSSDESSVEAEDNEDDDLIEDSDILAIDDDLFQENATTTTTTTTNPVSSEEKWGDRDTFVIENTETTKEKHEKKEESIFPVRIPNLSPTKCRTQLYGMPRGHWPWMVALLISSRHVCSGALLDEKHVLTAAHCVEQLDESDIRKLRVIIGDRVMYSTVDGPHFWRKVSKVITHLNYNSRTFASDIAIIRMNSAVPFSRNIQPVSLPETVPIENFYTNQSKAIVAGWSGADIGQPTFEPRPEVETVVDFMDKRECREIYRGFALSGVAQNTFCTKPSNSTCVADSGGPLVMRLQNCWQLMGIMSWGLGCSHFPEVYTDVTRYVPWIRKHININQQKPA